MTDFIVTPQSWVLEKKPHTTIVVRIIIAANENEIFHI
jgi:hypothetical protein